MGERELPEGWEWTKLGEISERIHYGYTASAEKNKTGPRLLRITDIQDNNVNWATVPSCNISEKDLPNYLLKSGDLVFARTGATVGKSFLIEGNIPESVFASYLIRVILKKNVNQKFIYYFFQSPHYWNQIEKQKVGAGQENVNSQKLSKIEIPLPPLPIQNQIVAVLEQTKAVKQQRQEADALMGALLQSAFREMFGDLSVNENGWNLVKLENICTKITDGTHVTPEYIAKGVPFLSVRNLTKGYLDFDDVKYISESEHQYITKRSKPEKGDILLTKVGVNYGIAEIVDVETEFSIFVSLALLKPKFDLVDPYYLKHCINSDFVYRQAQNRISGIGVPDLHLVEIKQFKIPLPPLALQQQFARIVQEVERIRERQAASGKEIEGLCEGLMQRAFAGELVA
nr:restriction endonuclease subunit S [uncultured Methanoregula sp.]